MLIRSIAIASLLASAAANAADWQPPRMPWGDPDLQGIWTTATTTYLVRPEELKSLVLTEKQAAYIEEKGEEALAMVTQAVHENRPYALAFVDMRMPPGWDGLETIERLWEVDPDLHVVICSAYSDQSWSGICQRLHKGEQFLILKKPFETAEVLQCAVSQVRKWNLTRQAQHLMAERASYTDQLEQRVQEQSVAIRVAYEETIHQLVRASMFRDKETGAHIRRVGLYSELLAREAGWSDTAAEQMRLAAPMHDIGKLAIPDSILQKPGPLTDAEYRLMQQHTTLGAQMLSGSTSPLLQLGCEIAASHHERWDGTGYPNRLSAAEIPESGRIVGIVDVYDALSHDRVYRKALSPAETLSELLDARGTHHDPDLLDLFITLLPEMEAIVRDNPDEPSDVPAADDPDGLLSASAAELKRWQACQTAVTTPPA